MQDLYKQIHIYLNMEEEISFEEFNSYYKKVLNYFNENADKFEEETLWKGLFISENVMTNAESRAKEEKGSKSKKFNKIAQRMSLWAQNFTARLVEKGYNEDEMNERFEKMFEDNLNE